MNPLKQFQNLEKDEQVGFAAVGCMIFASIIYNWQIFTGQSAPSVVSWAIWGSMTILNFTSIKKMTGDWLVSLLPTINSALCIFTLCAVSKNYYYSGKCAAPTPYDGAVLVIGLIAVICWKLFNATVAQFFLQLGLIIGFITTYTSVWYHPGSEMVAAWIIWTIGFAFQEWLVTLRWKRDSEKAGWMDMAYPLNGLVNHLAVTLIILLR